MPTPKTAERLEKRLALLLDFADEKDDYREMRIEIERWNSNGEDDATMPRQYWLVNGAVHEQHGTVYEELGRSYDEANWALCHYIAGFYLYSQPTPRHFTVCYDVDRSFGNGKRLLLNEIIGVTLSAPSFAKMPGREYFTLGFRAVDAQDGKRQPYLFYWSPKERALWSSYTLDELTAELGRYALDQHLVTLPPLNNP